MEYLFLALRKFFAKLSFKKAETASPASLADKSKFTVGIYELCFAPKIILHKWLFCAKQ